MKRPAITFINRIYPPEHGATGRVLQDLAQAFAREGWRVTIITTGRKKVKERDGAIHVHRIKAKENPSSILDYLWILVKLTFAALREPTPHVVVTMTDPPLCILAGDWIKRRKKCRHIHWCHDLYPDLLPVMGEKINPAWLQTAYNKTRDAMENADRIIVVGRCMGRLLTTQDISPQQITFIPNWPNLELTIPESVQKAKQKSKPSPPPPVHNDSYVKPHEEQYKAAPQFRILYAGTLGRVHPIDTILEAAQSLQTTLPAVEFVFVGQGEGFDRLAQERATRCLENIRLLPPQPASGLRALMESGDLHLISMNEDAAGMLVPCKLYSAFAATRPCIFVGPAASETAKAIEEYKAGHVIAQGDSAALIKAITSYVTDSDTWFSAQKGAVEAAETYLPQQSIDSWIKRAWAVIEPDIKVKG